jgi:hypothetical protein
MNLAKKLALATIIFGALAPVAAFAAPATIPNKPWHVRDLRQEGPSNCAAAGWSFTASWKPIVLDGKPWPKYKVGGCTSSTYQCTSTKCTAQISSCPKGRNAVAMVTADYGISVAGMRSATVTGCK